MIALYFVGLKLVCKPTEETSSHLIEGTRTMNIQVAQIAALLAVVAFAAPLEGQQNYQCQSEGFQVNPSDCARFVRCVDQYQNGRLTPFHFSCPAGKLWRP